jgi:uncharacterized protein (DUF2236 family)
VPGSAGGVPRITAIDPSFLGNARFNLTIDGAAGGAVAVLVIDSRELPLDRIPATVPELREYIASVVASGDLVVTDAARAVAALFKDPPPGAAWRPVLRAVSRWAFGTLPPELREQYGERSSRAHDAMLVATLAMVRSFRPALPRRYRYIQPAVLAARRLGVNAR